MDEEKVMNEKEKVNQITEGVIWKQLLLFFFPIVFGTFFQQIYNTADTIVVGRFVGKQALAAVGGSASQIANLSHFFANCTLPSQWSLPALFSCGCWPCAAVP